MDELKLAEGRTWMAIVKMMFVLNRMTTAKIIMKSHRPIICMDRQE